MPRDEEEPRCLRPYLLVVVELDRHAVCARGIRALADQLGLIRLELGGSPGDGLVQLSERGLGPRYLGVVHHVSQTIVRRRERPTGRIGHAMTWPEPVERVSAVLRAAAIDARIEEFGEGTPTAKDAARAVGCELEQIVKSVVLVCDGAYVMALVPGDRRAGTDAVREAVGAVEVRVARASEVLH